MAIELTYAEVETTLALLNRIADDKRIAFKARLKHFQRLGFPPGANTGTGKRVAYSIRMFLKLCFAVEFAQAGMSPARIVRILNDNWQDCEASLLFAMTPEKYLDHWSPELKANQLVWMVSPESLRDLSVDGEGEFDYKESITVEAIEDLPKLFLDESIGAPVVGELYRHLIILLRPFLFTILAHLIAVRADIDPLDVFRDLEAGLVETGDRLRKLLATVDVKFDGRGDT